MVAAGRRPLSRRRVLEAAVRLADREGLGALTMRRLGAELGVEAMSLYNHVPNKGALLDGMVEVLLGEVEIPPRGKDWDERIREGYRAFRRLAHVHPNVFPLLVDRRAETMDGVWLVEEFLLTLREAGFGGEEALHAFRALSSYAFGYSMAEIRGFTLEPDGSHIGVGALSPDEFPSLCELRPYLEEVDHDREFEFGLDLLISGLRKRI